MIEKIDREESWWERNKYYVFFLLAMLGALGLWYWNYNYAFNLSCDERGTFGDMFGAVNSIFSGLAFAGIIVTIIMQSRELKYQREELKGTKEEFKIQNKTIRLQRFENTFFQMLNLFHQIVNDIDLDGTSKSFKGRDVFQRTYDREKINGKYGLKELMITANNADEVNKLYNQVYPVVQTNFGHYFRYLYRVFKYIHDSELLIARDEKGEELPIETKNNRYRYSAIARALLSDYELLWLFYNGLWTYGKNFKELVEIYALLDNLPDSLLAQKSHKTFYKDSAYLYED